MRYKLVLMALATVLSIGLGWLVSGASTFTGTTTFITGGELSVLSVSAEGRIITFGDSLYDRTTGVTTQISGFEPVISADGHHVAFAAGWSEGGNNRVDVFVRDLETGETTRVSVDSDGVEANDISGTGYETSAISAEGRYVAFFSWATNLVPGGTPFGIGNIFVHDCVTRQTELVSLDSAGHPGNGFSGHPSLSADGRYVAFYSYATNLVPADDNGVGDIFVHDRKTGETTRVNVDSSGNQANGGSETQPSISADGRYVAFDSTATNLVPGDNNGAADVFLHNRLTGQTELVSVSSDGVLGNDGSAGPSISSDGRYVAFASAATNFVSLDTPTPTATNTPVMPTTPTSTPGAPKYTSQVYVYDRNTGQTTLASIDSEGKQGDSSSWGPVISGNGRYIAFTSEATNLAPGSPNGWNVLLYDRGIETVSVQAGAGDTVTTDTDGVGATASDPVETYVTTPNSGMVSIDEGPITTEAPNGFEFLIQQVDVSAPAATAENPLVILFRLDSSQIPPGENQNTIQIFKNGVQVPACTGPLGTASPDPCVSDRALLPDGDVEVTVLTSAASAWNVADTVTDTPTPTPTPTRTPKPGAVGGIAEPPDTSDSSGGSPPVLYPALAAAAVGVTLLAACGWYARRRRRVGL